MQVGCGEWGFREMPMQRHFEICREFGFHWLEFGIGGGQVGRLPESPTEADVAAFRELGQKYSIETPFCCLENDFTLADAGKHSEMLETTLAGIRSAKECGATLIRLFAGFTPAAEMDDAIWQRMLDAFVRSDALCAELGMVIAIETHGTISLDDAGAAHHTHTVSTHPDWIGRLLEELPQRIGFNYDPGNLKPLAEGDSRLRLGQINSRINYCHLKDWKRLGDGWVACAIGDDDLDYRQIFEEMTFNGVYLLEYEPLHDPLEGIQRSLDYLKSINVEIDLGPPAGV